VLEHGGFRAAAQALRVSQPPLSRALAELEDDLGVRLVERDRTAVRPTHAGTRFARDCTKLLAALDDACRRASQLPTPRTTVRLGHVLPEYLAGDVERRLRALRERSSIAVAVTPILPRQLGDLLRRRELDLGVVFLPFEGDAGDIVIAPLGHDAMIAAVPAGLAAARRGAVSLASLARHAVVLFPRRAMPERHDEVLGHFHRAGHAPRVITVGPSLRAALERVAAGDGVSLVPARAAAAHADLAVALRPVREITTVWTLAVVHRARPERAVLDVIAALR